MGEKQIMISISREFGSGGHEIARRIAEYMQLEFLDRNMIEMIAKEKLVDANNLHPYDEAPRFVPRRTVRGHSSSPEETIAQMQFEFLRKKAENGDSFILGEKEMSSFSMEDSEDDKDNSILNNDNMRFDSSQIGNLKKYIFPSSKSFKEQIYHPFASEPIRSRYFLREIRSHLRKVSVGSNPNPLIHSEQL